MKFFTDRSGPQGDVLPIIVLIVSIGLAALIGNSVSDTAGAIAFFVIWPLLIFLAISSENAEKAPKYTPPAVVYREPVVQASQTPRGPTFDDVQASIDQRHTQNVKLILSS